jgi:hypothetical protein
MKVKKILLVIVALLFLASIPLAIYLVKQRQEIRMRAAPASTLSFTPSSLTISVGESFTLDAVIETETNIVPAVELHITFDPGVFEATALSAGPDLPDIFDGPTIDNQLGEAFIVVGDVGNPVEGSGTVASISFNVIDSSDETEKIDFSSQTQAGAWYEEGVNVLIGTNPASITISEGVGGSEPTATPTPEGDEEPTATPTPEEDGEPTPTSTPTPSGPTSTPVPTSTPTLGPTATPPEATSTPPVTGISTPTWGFLGIGLILLTVSLLAFL